MVLSRGQGHEVKEEVHILNRKILLRSPRHLTSHENYQYKGTMKGQGEKEIHRH